MKTLIVYYSRSGITRKVAEELRHNLDCDIEELIDKKDRSGSLGYMRSVINALRKSPADLEEIKNDPASYDLVIIGTPVWTMKMSTPIRTYIQQNHPKFNNVAFLATAGGNNFEGTFSEMREIIGTPLAEIGFQTKEVNEGTYKSIVAGFAGKIREIS
jgi:flavodoxin